MTWLTLDFFSLHRSHALQTLFRTLPSECEWSDVGDDWRAVIVRIYILIELREVWLRVLKGRCGQRNQKSISPVKKKVKIKKSIESASFSCGG